jgi:hypothetical protein
VAAELVGDEVLDDGHDQLLIVNCEFLIVNEG